MKFGRVRVAEAKGNILAHSLKVGLVRLKKGSVLSQVDLKLIQSAGIDYITTVHLGSGDIGENTAAQTIGLMMQNPGVTISDPVAGRVNCIADADGLLVIDTKALHVMNAVDEAITIATLPNYARVQKGALLATIKIIPYGVDQIKVHQVKAFADQNTLKLVPFKPRLFDLILTQTPGFKESLLSKGRDGIQARVRPLGLHMNICQIVPHTETDIANALLKSDAEIVLILGASATSDRLDVIPAGITQASGQIVRYGMPVDPGNLLVLGKRGDQTIVGLPGCARAPALNGTDWVLERLAVGMDVSHEDIARMGVGGLLKEIPGRIEPRLRHPERPQRHISAIVLAAGQSKRMRGEDKLLRSVQGKPLLRRMVQTVQTSNVDECIVVVPAGTSARQDAIKDLPLNIVEAVDAPLGMSASLRAGLDALDPKTSAVLVILADMPDITADHINRIIAAHDPDEGRLIVCPTDETGQRGHPVLFDASFAEPLRDIRGDRGARDILETVPECVYEVPLDQAVTRDLDTPEDWVVWENKK